MGLTESEARANGWQARVVRLSRQAIDRAQTEGDLEGCIKFILPPKGDTILGAHLVGARAGELLGELAMQQRLGLQDALATLHAYPTLSVGLQQADCAWYLE